MNRNQPELTHEEKDVIRKAAQGWLAQFKDTKLYNRQKVRLKDQSPFIGIQQLNLLLGGDDVASFIFSSVSTGLEKIKKLEEKNPSVSKDATDPNPAAANESESGAKANHIEKKKSPVRRPRPIVPYKPNRTLSEILLEPERTPVKPINKSAADLINDHFPSLQVRQLIDATEALQSRLLREKDLFHSNITSHSWGYDKWSDTYEAIQETLKTFQEEFVKLSAPTLPNEEIKRSLEKISAGISTLAGIEAKKNEMVSEIRQLKVTVKREKQKGLLTDTDTISNACNSVLYYYYNDICRHITPEKIHQCIEKLSPASHVEALNNNFGEQQSGRIY